MPAFSLLSDYTCIRTDGYVLREIFPTPPAMTLPRFRCVGVAQVHPQCLNSRARWFSVGSLRCNSLFSLFLSSFPCAAVYHRLVPMITSIDYSLFARWRGVLWLLCVLLYLETSCDLRERIGLCWCFVYVWWIAGVFNIACERVCCLFYIQWLY